MNPFVAVLQTDGADVSQDVLDGLARALPALGPLRCVRSGPFGLAEVALAGTDAADGGTPPEPEDADVVVGGAIRLDALGPAPASAQRAAVVARVRRGGLAALPGLRGDLGFVTWDARRRRLLALRDLLGVAPVLWARAGARLLIASEVAPLLREPGVDRRPDERAVGDFLLIGENAHPARSFLRGVHRLPAGHVLHAAGRRVETRRHDRLHAATWDDPPSRAGRLAEELWSQLDAAVARRLPARGAALLLSGGLDSAAVGAAAAARLGGEARGRLLACTFTAEPDLTEECAHAAAVAAHLGLPHHVEPLDRRPLFGERALASDPAGPALDPRDPGGLWQRAARHAPVILTGFGGDPALLPSGGAVGRLLARGRPLAAAAALLGPWIRDGRRPPLGLRRVLGRLRPGRRLEPRPPWIAREFAERLELDARWRVLQAPPPHDPTLRRPEAAAHLASPFWPNLLECLAPSTDCPAALRHPWLDPTLLEWLLAAPPTQVGADKGPLREALRGRLPEATRTRPKALLARLPAPPLPAAGRQQLEAVLRASPRLADWLDVEALVGALRRAGPDAGAAGWAPLLPPLAVGLWLTALESARRPADGPEVELPRARVA